MPHDNVIFLYMIIQMHKSLFSSILIHTIH